MNANLMELLPEFALGTLPSDEMERIERAVSASPALQAAVDAITEGLAAEIAGSLAPVPPSRDVRARLLQNVDGVERFAPFFAAMADIGEQEIIEDDVPFLQLISKKIKRDAQGFGKYRGGMGYEIAGGLGVRMAKSLISPVLASIRPICFWRKSVK